MQINVQEFSWQIILNPCAMSHRSGRFWAQIEKKLQSIPIQYEYHVPELVEDAKILIKKLCQNGFRHFIVIGGDGTFNNFINSIMDSEIDTKEVFLIPIALGTGNDWLRTHFRKNKFKYTMGSIAGGNFTTHDVGLVEVIQNKEVSARRYFINIAGFGFDAAIIKNANEHKPILFPAAVYIFGLLKTLLKHKAVRVSIESKEGTTEKMIFSMAIGIGQFNGNGMMQCPDAIPNDHLFDVIQIEQISKMKVIKNVKYLFDGSHIQKLQEISMFRTQELHLKSDAVFWGEVEGELLPSGAYKISCIPAEINILSELWN
jgi:YegS/Rv2252/BmrU family lipid kinase